MQTDDKATAPIDRLKILRRIANDTAEPRLVRDDAKRLLDVADLRDDFNSLFAELMTFREAFKVNVNE
jgi:hypothetical protein